jgi:hypothetical protein
VHQLSVGLVILLPTVWCFYLSNNLWRKNTDNWHIYHMVFHFGIMCEQMFVLFI